MLEFLNNIDTDIFLLFNGMHAPFFDRFMLLFTGRFIWIPMYAAILILIVKTFGLKKSGLYIAAIALAIALTDQTCATLIRPAVERLRPSNPENPLSALTVVVDGYRGGSYGFPSCHSANSFALATILTCILRSRKMTVFILAWAILNSYTRLYLGVHYPGDLLIGAVIGSAFGFICYKLAYMLDSDYRKNRITEQSNTPIFSVPLGLEWAGVGRMTLHITAGDLLIAVGSITAFFIFAASAIA